MPRDRPEAAQDWGTTPAAIDNCLSVAEMPICSWRHSDTLNESGFVEKPPRRDEGRSLCAFHTKAAVATRPTSCAWGLGKLRLLPTRHALKPHTLDEH